MSAGGNKCKNCGQWAGKGHQCPTPTNHLPHAGINDTAFKRGYEAGMKAVIDERTSRAAVAIAERTASTNEQVPFKTWSGTRNITEKQALTLHQHHGDISDIVEGEDGTIGAIIPMRESSDLSPREWDNTGIIVASSRSRYLPNESDLNLDSESMWAEEAVDRIKEEYGPNTYVAPIYAYDHGNVAFSVGSAPSGSDKWDTSVSGFMVIPESKVMDDFGDTTPESWEKAKQNASAEMDTYEKWANGDVYGISVIQPDGEEETVWGFYGEDDAREGLKDYL